MGERLDYGEGDLEVFDETPLTADLIEPGAESQEMPPLEKYVSLESVAKLTNLFDELAKKYEDLSYKSENAQEFAQELKGRIEEIFSTQNNQISECVKSAFYRIGEIAETDLAFALDRERASGDFIPSYEAKVLEWFDGQSQRELLNNLIDWQQSVMKMIQWLSMLEGGKALTNQFYERWGEFASKRIGQESAESRLRGISGPLVFSKLCDEAGYDVFLPNAVWDRDAKIDLVIKPKDSPDTPQDIAFVTQMKARKSGQFAISIEGEQGHSTLQGKAMREKESLIRSAHKLDNAWSKEYNIRVLPLFVTMEGLDGNPDNIDLATCEITDEESHRKLIDSIHASLQPQLSVASKAA